MTTTTTNTSHLFTTPFDRRNLAHYPDLPVPLHPHRPHHQVLGEHLDSDDEDDDDFDAMDLLAPRSSRTSITPFSVSK
jgi:hypothetical protein